MITIKRTTSESTDFQALVKLLDEYLAFIDGDEHAFYNQFNKVTMIKHAVVVYYDAEPIGCGAIKAFSDDRMEVKRMYVKPEYRGKGIASLVLKDLENWASELKFPGLVLETGKKQQEAIQLYLKNNYNLIPNYGQYIGIDNSVCMEKII
ncbi:GNAT family N-acetyltransferase [Solitalea sp. MAHUQ-68]|uniref:GNAT family N-acetyltransferase n=1 Tax=Solitalea agri TaxID=2953739 RepID=A0A9X2FB78_9SPHI|nr:GNAT family N-acetyltransferase [Solitalea agri]MCO4293698.1 GNAT family N-acetyltransferase [Solitalea agri]